MKYTIVTPQTGLPELITRKEWEALDYATQNSYQAIFTEDQVDDKDFKSEVNKALELAIKYGGIDGAHHKTWVIDQMVRALCGTNEAYEKLIINLKHFTFQQAEDF